MNDVLSKYIQIATEIILFSLLISIIALFGGVAKQALNNKVESNVIMNELNDYRKVYRFIELADTNTKISGDDVVQFLTEFKRVYDVELTTDKGQQPFFDRKDVTSDLWDTTRILDVMESSLTRKYNISYVINKDTNTIEKFVFDFSG